MLGALVFGIAAAVASVAFGKPIALAIVGAVAGVVWASPHIPVLGAVGGQASGLAFALFLGVMAACAVGLAAVIRKIRPPPEYDLEVVEYDAAEDYEASPYPTGLERHFDAPGPREARMPGMWASGLFLVVGLASSDLAWAARGIARLAGRWRGRGGRSANEAQGRPGGGVRNGRLRQCDRAAA